MFSRLTKVLYEKILSHGYPYLKFPKNTEKVFLNYYHEQYRSTMYLSLILGLIIFDLSYIIDLVYSAALVPLFIIRFFIVTPVVLALLFIMSLRNKWIEQNIQKLIILAICVISLALLAIALYHPNPMRDKYFHGFILIAIFAFILSRLQFWQALSVGIIVYLILLLGLTLDSSATSYSYLSHSYIYLTGLIILSIAGYSLEKSTRMNFLQTFLLNYEKKELHRSKDYLEKLSNIDELTGVANYRGFHSMLNSEWNRALRNNNSLSILFIDIDYFKSYNDRYGHQAGNECIKYIANTIKLSLKRATDIVARYGGDEFVVILEGLDIDGTILVSQTIQKNILHCDLKFETNLEPKITVSIGVVITKPTINRNPAELIRIADKAVYEAKQRGRNKIILIETHEKAKNGGYFSKEY